ncbi:MAG: MBL fold metallo-hydrolase [Nocardioides sp.]
MTVAKVHHLNCGTMAPPGHQFKRLLPARLVAHVLLVETADRLILVDTGFGTADVKQHAGRLSRPLAAALGARLDASECAVNQVSDLGHDPADVTDVVLTHMDLDHAGGLSDFPGARVHLSSAELHAATHPTLREKPRYVEAQWAHGPDWVSHDLDASGESWHGFTALSAIGDDVVMIALAGHTRGHTGVAVSTATGWLLHAGDAYFAAGDTAQPRQCPPGLKAFQRMMAVDNAKRRDNLARLSELRASGGATIFSAHDAQEFAALS